MRKLKCVERLALRLAKRNKKEMKTKQNVNQKLIKQNKQNDVTSRDALINGLASV